MNWVPQVPILGPAILQIIEVTADSPHQPSLSR
jgi:hypothetical protein